MFGPTGVFVREEMTSLGCGLDDGCQGSVDRPWCGGEKDSEALGKVSRVILSWRRG
jgi:hypothetical protein